MKKIHIKRHKIISRKRIASLGLFIALQANSANLYCGRSPYKAKARQLTKKNLPQKLVEEVENNNVLIPLDKPSIDTPTSVSKNISPSNDIHIPNPKPSCPPTNVPPPSGSSIMTGSSYSMANPLPKVVPSSSPNGMPQPALNIPVPSSSPNGMPQPALNIPVPPPLPPNGILNFRSNIPVPPPLPPDGILKLIKRQPASYSHSVADEACIPKTQFRGIKMGTQGFQPNELIEKIRQRRGVIQGDEEEEEELKQDDRATQQAAVQAIVQDAIPFHANQRITYTTPKQVPNRDTIQRTIKLKVVENEAVLNNGVVLIKGSVHLRPVGVYHPNLQVLQEPTAKEPRLIAEILRDRVCTVDVIDTNNDYEADNDRGSESDWED